MTAAHADIHLSCANLGVVHGFSQLPISTKDFHHSERVVAQRHHARIKKCQDDNEDESLQGSQQRLGSGGGLLAKYIL